MKKVFPILDSGHGGFVDGKYTTAPKKMFKHKDGTIAYEGVINRRIKAKLIELLGGRQFADVSIGENDITLGARVREANKIYGQKKGEFKCLYVSIHSNAGGGRGFEVWTSPGQTMSDKYADIWAQEIQKMFPGMPFRADKSDGDLDKEEKFYVLVETAMPAVLAEYLFFDNYEDWKIQQTDEYIEKAARSIYNFILRADEEV